MLRQTFLAVDFFFSIINEWYFSWLILIRTLQTWRFILNSEENLLGCVEIWVIERTCDEWNEPCMITHSSAAARSACRRACTWRAARRAACAAGCAPAPRRHAPRAPGPPCPPRPPRPRPRPLPARPRPRAPRGPNLPIETPGSPDLPYELHLQLRSRNSDWRISDCMKSEYLLQ